MDTRKALTNVLWGFLGHNDECEMDCYREMDELVDEIMAALEEE